MNEEPGIVVMKGVCIWIALALMVVVAAGCVSEPADKTKNETVTTPTTTLPPTPSDITKNETQATTITPTIPPPPSTTTIERMLPPKQIYIKAGQFQQFNYQGHNITINYISAYPTQIVKITFDGTEKIIQKELSDSPKRISWGEGGIGFNLRPVLWEIRDGQNYPVYESTWNTTELYFEASGFI